MAKRNGMYVRHEGEPLDPEMVMIRTVDSDCPCCGHRVRFIIPDEGSPMAEDARHWREQFEWISCQLTEIVRDVERHTGKNPCIELYGDQVKRLREMVARMNQGFDPPKDWTPASDKEPTDGK